MCPLTLVLFVQAGAQWLWPSGWLRTSPPTASSHLLLKREGES
jgi:hypothetical protein